jgi:hypothetical protein
MKRVREDRLRSELLFAKRQWQPLPKSALQCLRQLLIEKRLSVISGDITLLENAWYVTHCGLLRLAQKSHCAGIHVENISTGSDLKARQWAFRATVYKSRVCRGFVGCGDADPSNVSPLVRGAEMRVAETRAVNRALRKAYGIGICSVEEIGSSSAESRHVRRMPPQSASGSNYGGPKVRDRLCQLIRQHGLNAGLVKSYAVDFCGTKQLRDASREQVEAFVAHLSDWAEKDRNALLCQLNSYLSVQRDRKNESEAAQEKAGAA